MLPDVPAAANGRPPNPDLVRVARRVNRDMAHQGWAALLAADADVLDLLDPDVVVRSFNREVLRVSPLHRRGGKRGGQ